jgi:hypothetical protein
MSASTEYIWNYTVQKEEPVRLIFMQRENILYMTDTIDVASFLVDFYVLYKFASLEYVECAGILITLLITYSSDANLDTSKNPQNMKKLI